MKKIILIPLIVVLATGLVLGSCGEPEETTAPTTTASTTTAPTTTSPPGTTAPPSTTAPPGTTAPPSTTKPPTTVTPPTTTTPATGVPTGTLHATVPSWIENFDPNLLTSFEFLIYEHLVGFSEDNEFIGELATDWSVSDDGLVWTYNIRQGIKFHNGDPFTSADAKFSIERVQVEGSLSPWRGEYRDTIDYIECPDDYTLKIYCKKVNYQFYASIWGCVMLPKDYIEEHGDDYFREHPVGTAPWKFVKLTPGVSIECEAVENHWRITPQWKNLIIELVPESSTALAKLRNGETDIVTVNQDEALQIQDEGYELRTAGRPFSPVIPMLGTWAVNGPTSSVHFRKALSLAINRQEIADEFFNGLAEVGGILWTAPSSWGYDKAWEDKYFKYDPEQAKQLLAAIGYPQNYANPVLKIYSHAFGNPWLPDFIMILSNYWQAIGVRTEVVNIEGGELRAEMYGANEPSLYGAVCSWNMPTVPISTPYLRSNIYSTQNWQLLHDPTFDAILDSITTFPDQETQLAKFREAVEYFQDRYICPGVVRLYTYYAVSDQVGEWTLRYQYDIYGGFAGMKKR